MKKKIRLQEFFESTVREVATWQPWERSNRIPLNTATYFEAKKSDSGNIPNSVNEGNKEKQK